jgi:histidine triad (HIT) family protein
MNTECLFCKIIAGDVPSRKVYDDDHVYAFLDIFPASRGHTLVIPKEHVVDILDSHGDIYAQVAQGAHHVAGLLKEKLNCDGITVLQANREAGWQTVFHLHMHVIPRWSGDALHKPWDVAPGNSDDLDAIVKQIVG